MAIRNKLVDLNNHLFAALERLNEDDISPEQMEIENKRVNAIMMVSSQIIRNASLMLEASKVISDGTRRYSDTTKPPMFSPS